MQPFPAEPVEPVETTYAITVDACNEAAERWYWQADEADLTRSLAWSFLWESKTKAGKRVSAWDADRRLVTRCPDCTHRLRPAPPSSPEASKKKSRRRW